MSDVLNDFFDNQTEDQKTLQQQASDSASSEESVSSKLTVSGRYLMEVATYAFPDSDTKEMRTSPELKVSEKKKSLMLSITLKVADGTPDAPKGASLYTNIVLSPAKGADQTKIENTMKMMKPKIVALTGVEKIDINAKWFEEYLLPKFVAKEDGGYVMEKDHKMKNKVMVVVEDDVYQGKDVLNVVSLVKAIEGDRSVSNKIVQAESTTYVEDDGETDINPEEAIVTEATEAPTQVPDVPQEPDDF